MQPRHLLREGKDKRAESDAKRLRGQFLPVSGVSSVSSCLVVLFHIESIYDIGVVDTEIWSGSVLLPQPSEF